MSSTTFIITNVTPDNFDAVENKLSKKSIRLKPLTKKHIDDTDSKNCYVRIKLYDIDGWDEMSNIESHIHNVNVTRLSAREFLSE